MKEEITKALIIGTAIVVAALLHAIITRNVGRYQVSRTETSPPLRIDTITGDLYGSDGRLTNNPLKNE